MNRISLILVFFVVVGMLCIPFFGRAASLFDPIIQNLPSPLKNFINGASNIIQSNVIEPASNADTSGDGSGIWQRLNTRFESIFGISLDITLQKIGDMVLFFLDLLTRPIRWIFS